LFSGWLTSVVFLPLVGVLVIALVVRGDRNVRFFAGAVALAELALSIIVFALYYAEPEGLRLVDQVGNWIPIQDFRVQYFLGIDGLSAPMVLLTGLLGMVAVFASWGVQLRVREYFVWLLALQTAVMGVFTALDFIMFFLFWELELVPMFFLISIWGSGRKEYSAMKFLIFTILGSAFMLVGILALFFSTGTFDMTALPEAIEASRLVMPIGLIFALLFIGFAVKLPVWPLHTWLPDAHTDAPTAGSVMLAGVLLKMGGYGMIRISAAMFPGVISDVGWLLATMGIINILYGAVVTLRQTDLKRLIAFSSISHMGLVVLGLASVVGTGGTVSPVGLTGASLQMFTHGTITGLLFLLVGMIYEKVHTRYIPDMGGLATRMPLLASAFLLAGLAALGLPGTSGFVSEITVFLGAFRVWSWITAISAFSVVLTAGYILWLMQRSLFGPRIERFKDVRDASVLEMVPVAALVIAIMVIGIYPAFISDIFTNGVEPIAESLQEAVQARLR
jgi:NADH-quinone oxidoreductase subunit M